MCTVELELVIKNKNFGECYIYLYSNLKLADAKLVLYKRYERVQSEDSVSGGNYSRQYNKS